METQFISDKRSTKWRIIDAAETLFSQRGFHKTSVRDITGKAEVNSAAVNYHFKSKLGLLVAVLDRRLSSISNILLKELKTVQDKAHMDNRLPEASDILRALIAPAFSISSADREEHLPTSLVVRLMSDEDVSAKEVTLRYIQPVLSRCCESLCDALPHLSKPTLLWRLRLGIGAISHAICLENNSPTYPTNIDAPKDTESLLALVIPFVTAGLQAPACEADRN
jgi:AcrR family transcriptional regulator